MDVTKGKYRPPMKILPLHIDYGTRYNPFSQFCCQVLDFKEGDETQTNSKALCHTADKQSYNVSSAHISPQHR